MSNSLKLELASALVGGHEKQAWGLALKGLRALPKLGRGIGKMFGRGAAKAEGAAAKAVKAENSNARLIRRSSGGTMKSRPLPQNQHGVSPPPGWKPPPGYGGARTPQPGQTRVLRRSGSGQPQPYTPGGATYESAGRAASTSGSTAFSAPARPSYPAGTLSRNVSQASRPAGQAAAQAAGPGRGARILKNVGLMGTGAMMASGMGGRGGEGFQQTYDPGMGFRGTGSGGIFPDSPEQ